MSYADKSIYEYNNNNNIETKQQWIAYFMMIGVITSSLAYEKAIDIPSTSLGYTYSQSAYSSALCDYEKTMKQIEIEKMKNIIEDTLKIKISGHWLPSIDVDKECIFFKCELSEEIRKDYEKMSDIELNMYLNVKDFLDNSKFFDMVAMI